jgi:drug/metabolite transporter (DMT)-like permease
MSKRGWLLFAAMGIIWGVPYLMIKVAVAGVSVPVLVFARTAVGALVLLPLSVRGGGFRVLPQYWRPMAAFAGLEIILPWWLLSDAERDLSSSMTGLLIAASPVLAVIVSRATGGIEPLRAARVAGLVLGLGGVAVLAAPELRGGDPRSIIEVLVCAVCYASGPQIAARRMADVPAMPVTAVCLAAAAVVYAPPAILSWPERVPTTRVLLAIAGLALICTALAFVVFFALIREVGATRAMVFTYINPAVAVAAGVVLLNEPLTTPIVGSFVLILAGSVLATLRRAPRPAPALDTP